MNGSRRWLLLLLLPFAWLVLGQGVTSPETPSPRAAPLSEGIPLATEDAAVLQTLALPTSFYLVARDTSDLRVYNGAGEVVPYRVDAGEPATSEQAQLPFYPVGARGIDDALIAQVRRKLPPDPTAPAPGGYLIDASGMGRGDSDETREWTELTFAWPPATAPFFSELDLYSGDDLENWRPLGGVRALGAFEAGDTTIQHGLTGPLVSGAYYWVRPRRGDPLPQPTQVHIAFHNRSPHHATSYASVTSVGTVRRQGGAEVRLFDAGGQVPVHAFHMTQGADLAAQIEVSAASELRGPWTPVYRGLTYQVRRGERFLDRRDHAISLVRARYWRLRLWPLTPELSGERPRLGLKTTPDLLSFAALGGEPFTLVYGGLAPAETPWEGSAYLRAAPRRAPETSTPLCEVLSSPRPPSCSGA